MQQLILSMGLFGGKSASLCKGLPHEVRDFSYLVTTHVLVISYICCKYVYFLCSSIFFSTLQVKNKPHDRDSKHAFILGPSSLVANTYAVYNQTVLTLGQNANAASSSHFKQPCSLLHLYCMLPRAAAALSLAHILPKPTTIEGKEAKRAEVAVELVFFQTVKRQS
jgi:hypothetical protein